MKYIADLHIHSRYSRSTSKHSNLQELKKWALIKGINVLGTGDFTHPAWFSELQDSLVPDGSGLFTLKEDRSASLIHDYKTDDIAFRFCLQAEISSIYKKNGQTRKVHSVIFAPDLACVARINAKLSALGNIKSDGRPILGLDPKDLLEIILDISPDCHLIPAHVWTPWFSLFGSKSGFDAIEECFEDLTPHIFALETGLSSDPPMNWLVSALDRFSLVSNSDAHSPAKLMREANLFDTELSYYALFKALQSKEGFLGTLEFFPEEGKYHFDGHRKCNVVLNPQQTGELHDKCPVCGKPLTIGVMHRVLELADREEVFKPPSQKDYFSIIPLPEILGEILGKGPATKTVMEAYWNILSAFGNEYNLLLDAPLEEIAKRSGMPLAEAVKRVRRREIHPQPGYDGEFGIIKVFRSHELEQLAGQTMLFKLKPEDPVQESYRQDGLFEKGHVSVKEPQAECEPDDTSVNLEQEAVVNFQNGAALVTAGPGTGKTRTLILWIAGLIEKRQSRPENILAITFTNKAAGEMRQRLNGLLGDTADKITVSTFHSFCFDIIKNHFPQVKSIYDTSGRKALLRYLYPHCTAREVDDLSENIEKYLDGSDIEIDEETQNKAVSYQHELKTIRGVDISALISEVNLVFEDKPEILEYYRNRFSYIAVDEFQDINLTQYKLLCALIGIKMTDAKTKTRVGKGILVIGDPDQAVYGFRGSDLKLFFRFQKDFQAGHFALSENYRSTPHIIDSAAAIIAANSFKSGLKLTTRREKGRKIMVAPQAHEIQEAKYIAQTIKTLVGGIDSLSAHAIEPQAKYDYSFADIAVLVRTHAAAGTLYPVFERQGIPVSLRSEYSLLEQPPYSLLSSYLHLLHNKQDVVAFRDIVMHSIGDLSLEELGALTMIFQQEQGDIRDILSNRSLVRSMARDHIKQFEELGNFLEFVEVTIEYQGVYKGIFLILEKIIPVHESMENKVKCQALLEMARAFEGDLAGFLRKIFLCTFESQGEKNVEKVHLLTFHAAKGLEFPVVFIAGAEEGITPLTRKSVDLEEERRLFYVALTRAKDLVYITYTQERTVFEKKSQRNASRFIEEIPSIYKELSQIQKRENNYRQPTFF
ncbi:MAG: UvrD-helicase domain-containing protein [Spirochaetales bacterium]|nr:UvrD-helicase domain-containing protein [Spirochaetales bacterium]